MQELQQIKKGKEDTMTVLTPDVIEKIPKVKLFHSDEMDIALYSHHKDLLNLCCKGKPKEDFVVR